MTWLLEAITSKVAGPVFLLLLLLSIGKHVEDSFKAAEVKSQLNAEIECTTKSHCADRERANAALAASAVAQVQAQAARDNAAALAELQKKLDAAVATATAGDAALAKANSDWQERYNAALKTATCDAWSKEQVACPVN